MFEREPIEHKESVARALNEGKLYEIKLESVIISIPGDPTSPDLDTQPARIEAKCVRPGNEGPCTIRIQNTLLLALGDMAHIAAVLQDAEQPADQETEQGLQAAKEAAEKRKK